MILMLLTRIFLGFFHCYVGLPGRILDRDSTEEASSPRTTSKALAERLQERSPKNCKLKSCILYMVVS